MLYKFIVVCSILRNRMVTFKIKNPNKRLIMERLLEL